MSLETKPKNNSWGHLSLAGLWSPWPPLHPSQALPSPPHKPLYLPPDWSTVSASVNWRQISANPAAAATPAAERPVHWNWAEARHSHQLQHRQYPHSRHKKANQATERSFTGGPRAELGGR